MPHIRSALAFRHVYSPMSVVDIVQLVCVSAVELYIPSVVYLVHTVCSMQVQLARLVNVRIGRSTDIAFINPHLPLVL